MTSSVRAAINGYTAWANVRLVREECESDNILLDVMQGTRMKVLLHYITGVVPKKLDNLNGLTAAQKVTRVDWFIDALKTCGKLPKSKKFDPQMFSLLSADHVFPVFWYLVCDDIFNTWEISPIFQKHHEIHVIIADPIECGPCKISRTTEGKPMPFYITADGKSVTQMYKRTSGRRSHRNAASYVIELVNGQLKMTVDGRKLYIQSLADLVDSRILCALVNSLIPGTFTTHVMLNDRWTINVALKSAAEIFRVKSHIDSQDIYENEEESMCTFLTYFIMSGYQFKQAQTVLEKMRDLNLKLEDLRVKMQGITAHTTTAVKERKQIQAKIDRTTDELKWIETVYDIDQCAQWEDHAKQLQAKVREMIALKMKQRFDTVVVPRPMTINRLIESMVINLSLTGGNGFYHSEGKESLWTGRKMVIRDKETGEYIDNFSGSENSKGTVREVLKVHPYEVIEINASNYPKLELFFESSSRNKTLKGGSKFLYQVFPGTTSQCERVLRRASRVGEIITVEKLILFFHKNKDFVNCSDPETGNTALHLACRHGHFEIALQLLENGAHINVQNNSGCTPFFLATEGLHKQVSQLLLEWGADIYLKNKLSKTALELIRNSDLKTFLETKFTEYRQLTSKLSTGDTGFLEKYLKGHVSNKNRMASLRSRCANGNTLLHMATALGSTEGIELILTEHVDPNLLNSKGATPLHFARKPAIIKSLVEHGATVDATDHSGNTALHILCGDKANAESARECIAMLVNSGARLDLQNNQGHLPIHCGASQGLISTIEAVLAHDCHRSTNEMLTDADQPVSSLIYLSLVGDHLEAAKWLNTNGFSIRSEDADKLAHRILTGQQPKCTQPAETFQFLLQCGANPNSEYTEANRPLHLSACLVNDPEITYMLLDHGAEVDPRNTSQSTPLFESCKANNPGIASTLIKRGADYLAKDLTGKCAFDYIKDHREWIDSGHFNEDIRARLKTFSLKHSRELVKSISQRLNTSRLK